MGGSLKEVSILKNCYISADPKGRLNSKLVLGACHNESSGNINIYYDFAAGFAKHKCFVEHFFYSGELIFITHTRVFSRSK